MSNTSERLIRLSKNASLTIAMAMQQAADELDKQTKALEFYANKENWKGREVNTPALVWDDEGEIAREALSPEVKS